MHQVSWAESAGAQAGAQASGCEGVKVGNEPPADKFWEEAEPGCWEVCLCAMLGSCGPETIPALSTAALPPSLTLTSRTELTALPARNCWKIRKVPEAGGEDADSDLAKSGRLSPTAFYPPGPTLHLQVKH